MKITQSGSVVVSTALLGAIIASAKPPDPQLLLLVPPDSQIVAGAVAPLEGGNRGNFLIFTQANTLDIEDFFSIVGADASRKIYQVIFAASAVHGGAEHSILVSGKFDSRRAYGALMSKASKKNYRGVNLVVVTPFERERALLHQDRWLAIINSRLAIFGTIWSAQQEIDRYLNGALADDSISNKLSSLRPDDDAWCLVSSLVFGKEIPHVLKSLDPAFAGIDRNSDKILFGIRFGRQVEFEYFVNSLPDADPVSNPPIVRSFNSAQPALSLTTDSGSSPSTGFRHVVKISKMRYDRWLADLTAH